MSSILLKMDKNAVEYANTTESGITMYVIISTDNRMDDDNIDFHQTVGPVKQNNVSMYILPLEKRALHWHDVLQTG